MYTNKENVLELVALLKSHDISHIVLCPGSRNIPIVKSIAKTDFFTCYSITDERSASFFAMGLTIKHKKPCALVVTSGSALLNTAPALSEAFYQKLPLLVISADRQQSFIGQMDGQTIHQDHIFPTITKKEVNLPEIYDKDTLWLCNRLINEALLALRLDDTGPVHINVPISDPFFNEDVDKLPMVRKIAYKDLKDVANIIKSHKKIMIILGQNQYPYMVDKNEKYENVVFISEHLTNINGLKTIENIEILLGALDDDMKKSLAPDLVITIGGHILSKKLKIFLRQNNFTHINIMPTYDIADVFFKLNYQVCAPFDKALDCILESLSVKDNTKLCDINYAQNFYALSHKIKEPNLNFSQVFVIGKVMHTLKESYNLHLSNSSTVRYAQLFKKTCNIEIQGNRGVNGIEGSLSTAIGASSMHDDLSFIIIGDLSFFYDLNALFNSHINKNVRIILINNEGGEIFGALPGLDLQEKSSRYILATHNFNAQGLCKDFNLEYIRADCINSFEKALSICSKKSDRAIIVEALTNKDNDIKLYKEYLNQVKALLKE